MGLFDDKAGFHPALLFSPGTSCQGLDETTTKPPNQDSP
jgi:hypothetical protein